MTPTCKAVMCTAIGEACVQEVPIPSVREGYTLFRTKAVALNPTDWKSMHFANPDAVGTRLGVDFAGVVEEVGPGVTKQWKKGDRVCGGVCGAKNAESGAFGEYLIAKGGIQIKIPDHLSFEEAATLGTGITTCGQGLYQFLKLPLPTSDLTESNGQSILIYGGSTATGILGIQYAKLSGLTVLTTASPHNFDYVRSMGADVVWDYHTDVEVLAKEIQAYTNNKLTLVWDCRPTADSGRLCALAMSDREKGLYCSVQPGTKADSLKTFNPLVDAGFTIGYTAFGESFTRAGRTYEAKPEDVKFAENFWAMSSKLLAAGKLKVSNITLNRGGEGLDGVINGLEDLKQGRVSGTKLVYTV
ncbi:hypothetical protein N7539_000664 [Penicillium diatomitis]|uniref:Enoyl reductase (ER) domain-containing protein n=1 Tax=Penicillium diatomitis TaxID=2819901 RepID=A0A9X0C2E0_9EURO|nr:uncharacterized protein N7539_000664 [Penicillium diatomitis]KAJ5495548.1 hypothetical protein N7539_000664 [Penicillium diatomitis]